MEFYFTDRKFNLLGKASTSLPGVISLYDDLETEEIDVGVSCFEGALPLLKENLPKISKMAEKGNFILFKNEYGEDKYFTIMSTEKNRKQQQFYFYSEDAGLDLLNEVVGPFEADRNYNVAYYVSKAAFDSGFKIGVNEIGHLTRKLKWEGEATATERLLSIATQFDHAEIKFRFEVNKMQVVEKYIDIYKKRGEDLNITLRLGHEIDNIITTESIEDLATALYSTGGTPEGKDDPITLKGYKYDDDRFYLKGDGILRDRKSIQLWSRFLTNDSAPDRAHIVRRFNYDTTSQSELCNRTVSKLKGLSEPQLNFEVDIIKLPDNVRIGDRVTIYDEEDELFLSTRILKLERSRSTRQNTATLGEFLIKESGIDQKLQELANKIASMKEADSSFLWIRYADDDKGNGMTASPANKEYFAIKAVLNEPIPSNDPADYEGLWVKIQAKDGIPGKDGDATYTWIRYADTVSGGGISNSPDGKKYIGFAYNKLTPTPSANPDDYSWFLAQGQPGENGDDGRTSYAYFAWADSIDGKEGFTTNANQSSNKGFLGTYSSFSPVQSEKYYDYAWIKLAGAFDEEIQQLKNNIDAVNKVVIQDTAPEEPAENTQWWRTENAESGKIIGYFKWDGVAWQPQEIQQSLLNIVELNAVEINGSVLTGSSFLNYWKKPSNGREGVMRMEDGILRSNFTTLEGGVGFSSFDDAGMVMELKDKNGKLLGSASLDNFKVQMSGVDPLTGKLKTALFGTSGIQMTDASQPYGTVNLTYEDLMSIPETPFAANLFTADFAAYGSSDASQPRYSRQNRLVQLSGAIAPKKIIAKGGDNALMCTLPTGVRPKQRFSVINHGSGMNRFRITITTDGKMTISHYGITAMEAIPVNAWIDISAVFVAG